MFEKHGIILFLIDDFDVAMRNAPTLSENLYLCHVISSSHVTMRGSPNICKSGSSGCRHMSIPYCSQTGIIAD